MAHALPIEDILDDIDRIPDRRVYGRVAAILGMLVEIAGIDGSLAIGARCDLLDRAAPGMALEKRAAVIADTDRERTLVLVVVRRTEREPASAGFLNAAEALEDGRLHVAHAGQSTTGMVGVPWQNTSTICEMPLGLVPMK